MNRLRFVILSLAIGILAPQISLANPLDTILPGELEHFKPSAAMPVSNGPKPPSSIDQVVGALNKVSEASDKLVNEGVTIHYGRHKIIPQIGFAAVGFIASVCGLGV